LVLKLPNVRKLFLPDKGHVICDVDLSGADAQVVAWEANDHDLKTAFRDRIDVHNKNGFDVFGPSYDPTARSARKGTVRDELKAAVHGTNYAGGIRTISKDLGWTGAQVNDFQRKWFGLHPGIREWHRRVERDLQTRRQVSNKFGYRIVYFDRPDNLLPKGLAWIPQSTIAGVCARAAVKLAANIPWADILLQVHDSLVFQIPSHRVGDLKEIREVISISIPYDDPLQIPWGLALSERSWGDIQKKKWEDL
jgi:DNA polymerase-1